jgi:Zn-finger nucleic acid-binding protein
MEQGGSFKRNNISVDVCGKCPKAKQKKGEAPATRTKPKKTQGRTYKNQKQKHNNKE